MLALGRYFDAFGLRTGLAVVNGPLRSRGKLGHSVRDYESTGSRTENGRTATVGYNKYPACCGVVLAEA